MSQRYAVPSSVFAEADAWIWNNRGSGDSDASVWAIKCGYWVASGEKGPPKAFQYNPHERKFTQRIWALRK